MRRMILDTPKRSLFPWTVLFGATLLGCGEAPEIGPPSIPTTVTEEKAAPPQNLLLITVDSLRADSLGCYGHIGKNTPTIDSLAHHSLLFEMAYSAAPRTAPSHASIFTSRHPSNHGVLFNGHGSSSVIAWDEPTFAEHLTKQGFLSWAVVSAAPLDSRHGFGRGFLTFRMVTERDHGDRGGASRLVNTEVANLLDSRHEGRPFFLWVHYSEPHLPYVSTPEVMEKMAFWPDIVPSHKTARKIPVEALRKGYESEVYELDEFVGELIAELDCRGLRENTLVALTAGHGEYLGEHGLVDHSRLFDEVLHVPLFLSWDGLEEGERRGEPVSTLDLVPTVLEIMGLPELPGSQGCSLIGDLGSDRPVFAEWRHFRLLDPLNKPRKGDFLVSVQLGSKKLIRDVFFDDATFFGDLDQDPEEVSNRREAEPVEFEKLNRILGRHLGVDLSNGLRSGADHIRIEAKEPREAVSVRPH